MKVTLRTIAGLLSSAVMVSCSNVNDDPDISQTPIEFGTTVSRAAVSDKNDLSSFSVWGGYQGIEDLFDGTVVDKNGAYTDGTRYWIPGETFNFYAVHPVLENASVDKGIITVNNFDCSKTGTEAVDLMTATAQRTTKNPMDPEDVEAVPFQFTHELARIIFVAKNHEGAEEIEGYSPKIHSAKLYGMYRIGNFTSDNLNNKTWKIPSVDTEQPSEKDNPFATFKTPVVINQKEGVTIIEALVFPQAVGVEYYIDLQYSTTSGDNPTIKDASIQLSSLPVLQWEAGKQYRYSFTVTPDDRILFDKPTINKWNEATGGIIIVD